jgi:hypothetical protein
MNIFDIELIESSVLKEPIMVGTHETVHTFTLHDKYISVEVDALLRDGKILILDSRRRFL